jgi:hypothetical protein
MAIVKVESYRDDETNKFVSKEKGRAAFKSSINLPAVTTGSSLMNMSGGAAMQMSPMESMKEVFLEIRDNTKETVELLKTAVMGDPAQNKRDKIARGNTDAEEGGPGILSRVGSTLGKLNPFGGGGMLDTLGKLLLAVGGIALLKVFGDKAVGPLADLIRNVKEGKISENLKEAYEYVKEVGFDIFTKLKEGVIFLIDGVKKVYGLVKDAYKAVEAYVMSFDTDKDGKLDKEEMDALKKDVTTRLGTFVKDVILGAFSSLFTGLGLAAGVATAASIVGLGPLKLALGLGTKPTGVPGSVGAAKLGMVGSLAIGLIVANSIFKTYQNTLRALEVATAEDGTVDYGKFAGSFFGGDAKGSWGNAFKQAKMGGEMFAGPGALIGLALAGPPGALVGGAIGYLIGSVVFGIAGLMGADKIEEFVDEFVTDLKNAKKIIGDFFGNLISGVTSLFKGDTFAEGFHGNKLKKQKAELAILESQYELMDPDSVTAKNFLSQTLQPKRDFVEKLQTNVEKITELAAEPENIQSDRAAVVHFGQEKDALEIQKDQLMNPEKYGMAPFLSNPLLNPNYDKDLADFDKSILEAQKKIDMHQQRIDAFKSTNRPQQLTTEFKNPTLPSLNLNPGGPGHPSNATIVANNKTNSDNTKVEQHQHGAGLMSSIGRVTSAKILASKFAASIG